MFSSVPVEGRGEERERERDREREIFVHYCFRKDDD